MNDNKSFQSLLYEIMLELVPATQGEVEAEIERFSISNDTSVDANALVEKLRRNVLARIHLNRATDPRVAEFFDSSLKGLMEMVDSSICAISAEDEVAHRIQERVHLSELRAAYCDNGTDCNSRFSGGPPDVRLKKELDGLAESYLESKIADDLWDRFIAVDLKRIVKRGCDPDSLGRRIVEAFREFCLEMKRLQEEAEADELKRRVIVDAMKKLPDSQRELLELYYFDEIDEYAIGLQRQLHFEHVEFQLQQARQMLRDILVAEEAQS